LNNHIDHFIDVTIAVSLSPMMVNFSDFSEFRFFIYMEIERANHRVSFVFFQMRNEHLEPAQSSGSESSPSWASNTPRTSTAFNFDLTQSQAIEDLNSRFQVMCSNMV